MENEDNKGFLSGLHDKIERPDIYDLTQVLDYTPKSLSPLYEQFLSPKNRGLGFKKTVRQKFDDFEGLGPGFVSIVDDKERGTVTRWSPYMGNKWVDEQNEKLWKAESIMNAPLALAPFVPIVAGTKAISRQRDFSRTGSYKDTKGNRVYPFPEDYKGNTVNLEKTAKTQYPNQQTNLPSPIQTAQSRLKLNADQVAILNNLNLKLDSSLSGSQGNRRDWSKYERDEKAYFLEQRWPRDREFNELGSLIKKELETLYPDIPVSSWKKHHTNPVAQGAKLLNGLKPEYRQEGVKMMLAEGISAGHNPAQLNMIPQEIHTKIHRFINSYIGSKFSVRNLELKYFNGADISTIPWEQRKIAIKEYSNVIRESNEKIYNLMTALAVNKKYGPNVLPEVLAKLNSKVDDPSDIGLDKHIEDIRGELARQEVKGTVPKINLKELIKKAPKDIDPKALKALRLAAKEGLSSVKALKESKYGKQLEFVFKKIETFEQLNLDL